MISIFGAAGFADMSIAEERQFLWGLFAISTMVFLLYCVCAFGPWVYACRRSLRRGQLSLRSFMVLALIAPPALVLLCFPVVFFVGLISTW